MSVSEAITISESDPTFLRSALSGSFAGMCQTYSGHPLDTIKVKMQTSPKGTYKGFIDCTMKTYQLGGVRAFFVGATPALATAVIENTLVFGVNESLKTVVKRMQSDPTQNLSMPVLACIGGFAGFFQAIFACPAEVIKCRIQLYPKPTPGVVPPPGAIFYKGPIDCARQTIREFGVGGLYRGFSAFVAREIPFYFVFFSSYEAVCVAMKKRSNATRDKLTALEVLVAGGIAGCTAWTAVVPADTVKSQMHTSQEGKVSLIATARHIVQTDGVFRGLFRGWTAIMIRAFPANAATFLGFELCRRYLPSHI